MTAIIILWLLLISLVHCQIPIPEGDVRFCFDFECFSSFLELASSNNVVIAGIPTFDVKLDSYTSLYLGQILELFDMPALKILTVVLETPQHMKFHDATIKMIELMTNTSSILVTYEHGFSSFGLFNIEKMKQAGYGPTVVYHMNHERPWKLTPQTKEHSPITSDHLDDIYSSTEELVASYDLHPLVLRNYFYSPLENHSHYLPVGLPQYSYLLGKGKEYDHAHIKLASQRSTYCHFKGRFDYSFVFLDSQKKDKRQAVLSDGPEESHVTERKELLKLYLEGRSGRCEVEQYDPRFADSRQWDAKYREYIARMAETAFALCPSGNNPETFRHYEVSLGA